MLNGGERKIDIQIGPPQMMRTGPLDRNELSDAGVRKPRKLLEG